MIKKLIYGLIFAIVITLGTAHGASTDKTINDLTAETAPATGDLVVIWDVSAAKNRKMTLENLIGEAGVSLFVVVLDTPSLHSSGSGVTVKTGYELSGDSIYATTLNFGTGTGVSLYVATLNFGDATGTGTSVYIATLNSGGFTASSAGVTINPDLFVDTNTLFVDASTNEVGIKTTDPQGVLEVEDGGTANSQVLKVTLDDHNVSYGVLVSNDTFSTNDLLGFGVRVTNDGAVNLTTNNLQMIRFDPSGTTLALFPANATSGLTAYWGNTLTAGISYDGTNMVAHNSSGDDTVISPHDPITGKWIFSSMNSIIGESTRVEMEDLVNAVESLADLVAVLAADNPAIAAQAQAIADKVLFKKTDTPYSQGQLKQILNRRKAKARARWKKQWKDKNKTVMISVEEIIDPISGVTSLKRNRIAIYPPDSEAEAAAVAQFRHIIPKYMKDMAGLP